MKNTQSTSESSAQKWELPSNVPPLNPDGGRSEDDINKWRELTSRIYQIATAEGWSKSEMARRIGMPSGSFSGYYSGKIEKGRLDTNNEKVARWLSSWDEMHQIAGMIPESPPFVSTPTSMEIIYTLAMAQTGKGFVTITVASGLGKTSACEYFSATRSSVYLVTVSPYTKTAHGVLKVLAKKLNVVQHDPARLVDAIGERLSMSGTPTLLIIDEAQNLEPAAIDQVRYYVDQYGCGLALVGNDEVYSRFRLRNDETSPQLKRRVSKRVRRKIPQDKDISMFIDAWGVSDPEMRKILIGIGHKPGALGQIDETLKLASMVAASEGRPLTADDIEAAWANRDVEGL